jgi:hypothetical protein
MTSVTTSSAHLPAITANQAIVSRRIEGSARAMRSAPIAGSSVPDRRSSIDRG